MGPPTCLIDPDALLVIDTSAAINLIATGCAPRILAALPQRVLAVDTVPAELEEGRLRGRQDAAILSKLISAHHVEIVTLSDAAGEVFETLVIGPAAMTLDDGEAATIAYAVENGAIVIVDERKAIRICRERFPSLRIGCTIDILAHPSVLKLLGQQSLSKAIVNALRLARMRVPQHYVNWVVNLIGTENAVQCMSLPRSVRAPSPRPVNQQA